MGLTNLEGISHHRENGGDAMPTLEAIDQQTKSVRSRTHAMPFGAEFTEDGTASFRLWAPGVQTVYLDLPGRREPQNMLRSNDGWHTCEVTGLAAGTRYQFMLPDGTKVPDPASRYQPEDAKGPSELIDPGSFTWTDDGWAGLPWQQAILYELHIGTFTTEGTFLAAIEKLDHLVELGVTAIEIMPVGDFPGRRNWGYDGVLIYAPDSSYGRPEDLKELVSAAHARGIAVLLDVVYNHFGPDANYLPAYAPQIFTKHHKTPWGDAVNYDDEGSNVVREFIIHNALYWLEEFHLDGLRLDAVHEIRDDSPKHVLDELAERVRMIDFGRPIHLILENEKNEARRLERGDNGVPRTFTAQWNDDMHHVLHTAATLEAQGYYGDYQGDTEKLARALAQGFAFQGETMPSIGKPRGEPSGHLPPPSFIAFMQNHDQIGNRAFGERISDVAHSGAVRAVAATYLLLPQIPMLFMGEEWCTAKPFPFFCDFEGDLGDLVRTGRRDEFKAFPAFHDPEQREKIPDPQAEETFQLGKLDWEQRDYGIHNDWFRWYKGIIAVRKQHIVPLLPLINSSAHVEIRGNSAVDVYWQAGTQQLRLSANLSGDRVHGFPEDKGRTLWQEGPDHEGTVNRPWSVRWALIDNESE
jgi:malto-oligosyltrehalose trehalohydrolase